MPAQELGKVFLEDGNPACPEQFHLGFVIVDAGDLVTHLGKANRGNEPDIS
jgi:hypothetical protein